MNNNWQMFSNDSDIDISFPFVFEFDYKGVHKTFDCNVADFEVVLTLKSSE